MATTSARSKSLQRALVAPSLLAVRGDAARVVSRGVLHFRKRF
jgi:hypothetical protein